MAAAAMKHMASNFAKLDKFKGVNFRRWQKKMHFLLSSMSVVYVLTTPNPEDGGDDAIVEQIKKRAKWYNDDYVRRGLILIGSLVWSHLRIKESLRVQDSDKPKDNNVAGPLVVNRVEHNNSSWCNDNKGKRKHHDNIRADPNKKAKPTEGKDVKTGQNMFNKSLQVYYVTYVSEAYFVQDDDVAWWVDSGATVHVCKDRCWFKTYESLNDGSILHMGNESTALVHGRGCVDLRFSSGKIVSLFNVLHVPNIRKNLVSSSVLNNCGYKQVIESNKFVLSKHGVFIGFGYLSNHMFRLNIVNDNIGSAFMSTSKLNDSILWHARLGHVHFKRMQDMSKDGLIPAFDMDTKKCKTCMLTKITKKPFQNVKCETEVLELIYSDLCDLHVTPSLSNKRYFVIFVDDASRGGRYMDTLYFQSVGTIHEMTAPYTPQQNGISERKNRILKEMVDSMLSYSGLSQGFWGEAMLTACYLLNRVPNKRKKITPYELWTKKKPNLNYLRVWGCRAVVRLPDPKLKTLGERGIECIFVGYAEHSKAFRFYVIEPNDSVLINSIIESRDAIFDENRFSSVPRPSLKIPNRTEDIGGSVVPEEDDPKTFNEAMKSQDVAFWKEIDGTIEKFKARLVIQGFKQKSGIYYFDTYALVTHISTIRLLIAMTSIHNMIIHQMDVKTTFLNDELDEEIYMNQPQGFIMPSNENKEFLSSRFSMKDMGEADFILALASNSASLKYLKKTMDYKIDIYWVAFSVGRVTLMQAGSATLKTIHLPVAGCGEVVNSCKNLLLEIPLWSKPIASISILCDIVATLAKAYSQMYNGKSRHLGVRRSMIRELISNEVVSIEFVRSQQNLVDHLMKGLARDLVLKSAKGMGLKSNQVAEC
ncbi:zinc finger, CCHC-type containing protein [Tanacetum coccineum]|uniref:Zinc finger, CCHC-type containing protein n=1 Tax=Tanacetum coccineum TaxID=301880 RepID=A0ABQ4WJY0_9ASTR